MYEPTDPTERAEKRVKYLLPLVAAEAWISAMLDQPPPNSWHDRTDQVCYNYALNAAAKRAQEVLRELMAHLR